MTKLRSIIPFVLILLTGGIGFADDQSCSTPNARKLKEYRQNTGGYCFAEWYTCSRGSWTYYSGTHTPVVAKLCGGKLREITCSGKMKLTLTVSDQQSATDFAATLKNLGESIIDTEYKIWNASNTQMEFYGRPWFENPILLGVTHLHGLTRAKLLKGLADKIPEIKSFQVCPGDPEMPSVIGSN